MRKGKRYYPATCYIPWGGNDVPCCEKHANGIIKLGQLIGVSTLKIKLHEEAECSQCKMEEG